MQKYLIKNISVVNEGKIIIADVLVQKSRIERIGKDINIKEKITEIDGEGKHLLPGAIDTRYTLGNQG